MGKMKHPLIIIFLFLCGYVFISCSESNSTQSDYYKYKGTWLWLKTTGGFAGTVTTPKEGTSIKISYDEFGRFKEFRNDSLKVIANYNIEEVENNNDKISYSDIATYNFYFNPESDYAQRSNDTLFLWDGMIDGYFSFYKKIN